MPLADKPCRVCNQPASILLDVADVPPLQNRYYKSKKDAMHAAVMDASFHFCLSCQHISIHKTAQAEFDDHYNNRHVKSAIVEKLYSDVASDIARHITSANASILEIGCGRGELLDILLKSGFTNVVGYDPAAPSSTPYLHNTYWEPSSQEASLDLVILRHTLEEIDEPLTLLRALRNGLKPDGLLYCEITNATYLIEHELFFSLFPECVNLYSSLSLAKLYASAGYAIVDITPIKGGEWLGIWAKPVDIGHNTAANALVRVSQAFSRLAKPVFLWGAGGRAGDMLSFMKLNTEAIKYVVDIDEAKQGLFIPPYGQQIISPDECGRLAPKSVVVMNTTYRDEIARMIAADTQVITLDDLLKPGNEGEVNG